MTLGGAMIMTMFNGPMLSLPWAKIDNHHDFGKAANNQVSIKGALMITAGCVSWSSFIVLQVREFHLPQIYVHTPLAPNMIYSHFSLFFLFFL